MSDVNAIGSGDKNIGKKLTLLDCNQAPVKTYKKSFWQTLTDNSVFVNFGTGQETQGTSRT